MNDTLLASASSDGELMVHALDTDSTTQEMTSERIFRDMNMNSPITMSRFSFTKRHVLASGYENGIICIWDLQQVVQVYKNGGAPIDPSTPQQNPMRYKFSAHNNICMGIAFSPVNNLLLCSSGLDGRLFFFDIVEGKQVKKIEVGAPLSTISFCADGHTIAVGTEQTGQVIIYDLKDSKKVKIELKGHDRTSRVTALSFSR